MNKNTGDGELEDYFHYHRTCVYCGKNWWSLHCPHDGFQNPCPSCGHKPIPITNENDYCDCEFVMPVSKLAQEANKAQQQLLQGLMEQAKNYEVVALIYGSKTVKAVPLSVIQNKLEGLSD